jgi:hypothetical protein
LSGAVFGFDTFAAFVHDLSIVSRQVMITNPDYLPNLQSLYGLARCLAVPDRIAWAMQAGLSFTCLIGVAALWRSRAAFPVKAAGLAAAIPLASAYIQAYDLTLLSVAWAFLYRHRAFDAKEWTAVAISILSFGAFWWPTAHPAALIACPAVGAIVWQRALHTGRAADHEHAAADSSAHAEPAGVHKSFRRVAAMMTALRPTSRFR